MKRYYFRRFLLFAICFASSILYASCAQAKGVPKPSLFSIYKLNELKEMGVENPTIAAFHKEATKICNQNVLSVTGKAFSYSDNPHDYCSIATYSWPDENNPNGPYVTKDGKTNPERNKFDRPKLDRLAKRLQSLSVAYYLTGDDIYYEAFLRNIRAWFLDADTYMEPNFDYAQVVKGLNNNRGQSYGLCELEVFTPILESVFLINQRKKIDKAHIQDLEKWFTSFLTWVLQSAQWASVSKSNNNIVAGCYVALVEMARFTGNKKLMNRMRKEYTNRILNVQIKEDGRQPAELRRTIGFGYSVGNLKNIVDFALIMENSGVKYYKKNQKRIDAAFEYLLQFVDNHEAFPYKQEAPWEVYEDRLMVNFMRLQRMLSKKSSIIDNTHIQTKNQLTNVLEYVY